MPTDLLAPPTHCTAPKVVTEMGAIRLERGGVAFRGRAPNADAVSVVGAFKPWEETAHPLLREEGGTRFGEVADAKRVDKYRFALARAIGTLLDRDALDPHSVIILSQDPAAKSSGQS